MRKVAQRTYDQQDLSICKQPVSLWAHIAVGAAGAVTLQRWTFPKLGAGGNAYIAATAPTVTAPTSSPFATGPGWPNIYQGGAEGVAAVSRTGTGLLTITLQDQYMRLLSMHGHVELSTGPSNIIGFSLVAYTANPTGWGSIIQIATLSATATAADATSASIIHLNLRLSNATEP